MADKRQQGIAERKARILATAKEIVARDGFEALTTRGLAEAAGVTAPTLYNLFGDKNEILVQMVTDTVEEVSSRLDFDNRASPLEMVDAILDEAYAVSSKDVRLHREMLLLLDRFGMGYAANDQRDDPGARAARRSVEMVEQACLTAQREGLLRGNLLASELSQQMFIAYRGPLRDLTEGIIDGAEMLRRQRRGFYMALAADASDDFRSILIGRLQSLEKTNLTEEAA